MYIDLHCEQASSYQSFNAGLSITRIVDGEDNGRETDDSEVCRTGPAGRS